MGGGASPTSAVARRDRVYQAANANWLLDLLDVVQHGPRRNSFHWRGPSGMLVRLGDLLRIKYGASTASEHLVLLDEIAATGNPSHWALLWVLVLSVDSGLQAFVCSADVRRYVGNDGRAKEPVDGAALANYLRAVRRALRAFAMAGLADGWRLRRAVLDWPIFGGRAHHSVAAKGQN